MSSRGIRVLRIALGVVGGLLALGSYVMGLLGSKPSEILPWLAPEAVGLLLLLVGLHAWIDWGK